MASARVLRRRHHELHSRLKWRVYSRQLSRNHIRRKSDLRNFVVRGDLHPVHPRHNFSNCHVRKDEAAPCDEDRRDFADAWSLVTLDCIQLLQLLANFLWMVPVLPFTAPAAECHRNDC